MAKLPYLSHRPPETWQEANRIAACQMAIQGFSVFPCYAFGTDKAGRSLVKRPVGPWKHVRPRPWQEIDQLWRGEWSEYLPAISLETHDLVVFDPDVRETCNGLEAWERLCQENPLPEGVPLVNTAGGGLHAYFTQRPDFKLGNGEGSLPKGINVRGVGGYVIAPGATLPDGRQWAYRENTVFRSAPMVPDWLFEMAHGKIRETLAEIPTILTPIGQSDSKYWNKAFTDEISALAAMPKGGRNNALNNAAFSVMQMVLLGAIDRTTAINALVDASHANGLVRDDGMPQVMQTIMSGFRGAESKPRAAPAIKLEMPRLEAPRCARTAESSHGATDASAASEPKYTEADVEAALRWYFEGTQERIERDVIIKGILPKNGLFFLVGPTKSGKSFVAVDFALSIASGTPFWGRQLRQRCGVAYIAQEGTGGLDDRINAAKMARGIGNRNPIAVWKNPGPINDPANFKQIISELEDANKKMIDGWGVQLGVIIMDTFGKGMRIKDINCNAEAMEHMLFLEKELEQRFGALFVGVNHTDKAGKFGSIGAQVYESYPETIMDVRCERDVKTNMVLRRSLILTKNKEGDGDLDLGEFSIESFQIGVDSDGDAITPGVIRRRENAEQTNYSQPVRVGKRASYVLDGIKTALEQGLWFEFAISGYSESDMVTVKAVTDDNLMTIMKEVYKEDGKKPRQIVDNARKAIDGSIDELVRLGVINLRMHGRSNVYWLV